MAFLKISGTDVSEYIQSLSMTHEPVWSTNAGRTLDATFVGDIVARKWKLQIQTKPLTQKESALISALIKNNPFFEVSFIPNDIETDDLKTIMVYSNEPSTEVYSYTKGVIRYQSLGFNLIEQ